MAKPQVVEDKQLEHMLKATAACSRVPERDTALLLTLYGTALGITELASITISNYLNADGSVKRESAVRVDVAHNGEERPCTGQTSAWWLRLMSTSNGGCSRSTEPQSRRERIVA